MKKHMVQWGKPIREPHSGGLLREASLYARWCQFCIGQRPDTCELPDLLGTLPGARTILDAISDRHLQGHRYDSVRQHLALSETDFWYAAGLDLFGDAQGGLSPGRHLRYCLPCLELGFHTVLFQHLTLKICPLHQYALEIRCPYCGAPLLPTWRQIARSPYACQNCEAMLVKPVTPAAFVQHTLYADEALAPHRKRLARTVSQTSRPHKEPHNTMLSVTYPEHAARVHRHALRHLVWGDASSRADVTHKVLHFQLGLQGGQASWQSIRQGTTDTILHTLEKLRTLCEVQLHSVVSDHTKSSVQYRTLRVQPGAKAVAVAHCQLAVVYGLPPLAGLSSKAWNLSHSGLWLGVQYLSMRSCQVPGSVRANQLLVEYEVLGLFCIVLKRLVALKKAEQVEWGDCPPPDLFCPAWRWIPESGRLFVRPRATWPLVHWLIDRYGSRVMQFSRSAES
ncbi:hypothetical protein [Ralstonia pickettii]|uniref:hypothetical protein n=1 Tax=Ralstonia pickettii TaxID=329 RepID=UPI0015BACE4D|nr:hypothetical protein [Ralstonia pickettii]NWK44467.1 hypothetical protein [Ralstonia pickettii]